jgi:ABC-type nitrate/sulfonate/bicarbonate transport system substrate-binding protein
MLLTGPGIVAASASTARTSQPAKTKTAPCTGPSTLNVGFSGTPGATNAPEIEFFKYDSSIEAECHLTVNLEWFASTSAEAAALLGGSVQLVAGGVAASLNTIAQGNDSIAVLGAYSEGGASIYVANKKYESYGRGINALKKYATSGLTWGVPSLGGAGSIFDQSLANKFGIPLSSIHFVVQGNNGEPGLISNQVQLSVSAPSNFAPALATGQYYTVWYSSGAQAIALDGIIVGSGLMATTSFINSYPALTQLVVTDLVKSLMWTRKEAKNPAAIWGIYSPAAQAGYPYSAWAPAWPVARAQGLVVSGYFSRTEYQQLANRYYNNGLLTTDTQIPAIDAPSKYITKAYKSLGLTPPTSDLASSELYWANEKNTGLNVG